MTQLSFIYIHLSDRTFISNPMFLLLPPPIPIDSQLRKDMEHTEAENSRLQNRIVSLQRELDYLKNRLDHAKETTANRQEIDELKLKHQYELSLAKRTQWVCRRPLCLLSMRLTKMVPLCFSVQIVRGNPFTTAVGIPVIARWNASSITGTRSTRKSAATKT